VNLVVALLVLGGSAVAAWAGLTDPPGGAFGAIGRALRGEPQPARKTPPSAADLIGSGSGGKNSSTGTATAGGSRAAVVAETRAQLGKPYGWGGNGPAKFDCSGLTVWVYKPVGVALPRTAALQQVSPKGMNVAIGNVQPGDLIFYGFPASHVAIAIGGGQVIHAPRPGKQVMVSTIKDAGYPHPVNSARDFLSTPLK
jgi:cell wall-associated NlpC family hydrolase